ncbi:NAD-dependent epimerase/dehydratase family protein [Prochlorococcus marinus]|uniref:NAD-dependent epimerase/dehydratase domain-containing protein n=1 Tax=Prochlorococcus marinus (strain AS9601) TaxID=146891 RepID=A2BSE5_PROMS|nr:NAD-dependent epimerase/dehydratase family protein [Prochlorococcus marinus]ABM70706.1 Hypothetical protein A9601_14221 [Prochlorococcus marinus str. AS9601]
MQKELLVTGSSGFFGSALINRALKRGWFVKGTARHSLGILSEQFGVDINYLDLSKDTISIPKANYIVHCATANEIKSLDLFKSIDSTIKGTKKLIEYCLENRFEHFIYISTVGIYGRELNGEINENSPFQANSNYALNHYYAEKICERYASRNFKVTIIRLSNVYGIPSVSTVDRNTLVPICFVVNLLRKGVVELNSSGLQQRDFINQIEASDIVLNSLNNQKSNFDIINASSGKSYSIIEIAKIACQEYSKFSGKVGKITSMPDKNNYENNYSFSSKAYKSKDKNLEYLSINETISELFKIYNALI